jgi:hypothetical protein
MPASSISTKARRDGLNLRFLAHTSAASKFWRVRHPRHSRPQRQDRGRAGDRLRPIHASGQHSFICWARSGKGYPLGTIPMTRSGSIRYGCASPALSERRPPRFWPRPRIGAGALVGHTLAAMLLRHPGHRADPGNTDRTEWQTRPWRPFALLAANACRHRLATPPLASTIQIGTTERWAPRVLFPTRDLPKGVAMAPSEKALQIVALQR